jgi:hypothetical protein
MSDIVIMCMSDYQTLPQVVSGVVQKGVQSLLETWVVNDAAVFLNKKTLSVTVTVQKAIDPVCNNFASTGCFLCAFSDAWLLNGDPAALSKHLVVFV